MKNCLIVLNYNDAESCISLIKQIQDYQSLEKIIVVDNQSTDNSYAELTKLQNAKIDVICTSRNGGYSYGNNYGCRWAIKEYAPEYLIICNPDIHFEENVLTELISIMDERKKENISCISCHMNCKSNPTLKSAWKIPNYFDCILNNLTILRKLIGDKTKYSDSYLTQSQPIEVDVLPGSFFIMNSLAFESVNGFDENVFLYNEENILSKKLKDKGWKNLYVSTQSYQHFHSMSIDKSYSSMAKKLDLAYESRRYYCQKYLKIGPIREALFVITYKIGRFNYLLLKSILKKS